MASIEGLFCSARQYLIRSTVAPFFLLIMIIWQHKHDFITILAGNEHHLKSALRRIIDGISQSRIYKLWAVIIGMNRINRIAHRYLVDVVPPRTIVWRDQLVVVAGSSFGVGAVLAEKLIKKGSRVAVLDNETLNGSDSRLMSVLKKYPTRIVFIETEFTSDESIKRAADLIREKLFHEPSMVVNCINNDQTSILIDPSFNEKIQDIINGDLIGALKVIRQFAPAMIKRKRGHILSLDQGLRSASDPFLTAFSASKSGIITSHETLQSEIGYFYKAPGVRLSVVHSTHTSNDSGNAETSSNDVQHRNFLSILAPIPSLDDVAQRILDILSEDSSVQVFTPNFLRVLVYVRVLPRWLQTALRMSLSGMSNARGYSEALQYAQVWPPEGSTLSRIRSSSISSAISIPIQNPSTPIHTALFSSAEYVDSSSKAEPSVTPVIGAPSSPIQSSPRPNM